MSGFAHQVVCFKDIITSVSVTFNSIPEVINCICLAGAIFFFICLSNHHVRPLFIQTEEIIGIEICWIGV
jgi:hypothetical protein